MVKRNRKLEAEVLAWFDDYHEDASQRGLDAVVSRTSPDFLGFERVRMSATMVVTS
jgi:hypothetical protein